MNDRQLELLKTLVSKRIKQLRMTKSFVKAVMDAETEALAMLQEVLSIEEDEEEQETEEDRVFARLDKLFSADKFSDETLSDVY